MSSGPSRPFVSAKFTPAGRTHSFLLPEFDLDGTGAQPAASPPSHGEQIVVETSDGPAMATVTRGIPAVAVRRAPPEHAPERFVELTCHPGYLDPTLDGRDGSLADGQLRRRVREFELLADPGFLDAVAAAGFTLVSASELTAAPVRSAVRRG